MLKGLYFEYQCLGATARGDTPTAPTLKNGTKPIDYVRIDEQVDRFNSLFRESSQDYCGHQITHKQLKLDGLTDGIPVEGTLDFVTIDDTGDHYVNDLKLTSDISGYWSNPSLLDHTQPITYSWLYFQNYGIMPKFRYWVFDYSTKKNIKVIDVELSDATIGGTLRLYQSANDELHEYGALEGFPRTPSPEQCSKCPLVDCSSRVLKSSIIYEKIHI